MFGYTPCYFVCNRLFWHFSLLFILQIKFPYGAGRIWFGRNKSDWIEASTTWMRVTTVWIKRNQLAWQSTWTTMMKTVYSWCLMHSLYLQLKLSALYFKCWPLTPNEVFHITVLDRLYELHLYSNAIFILTQTFLCFSPPRSRIIEGKEKDDPKTIPLKIFAKDIGNCAYVRFTSFFNDFYCFYQRKN